MNQTQGGEGRGPKEMAGSLSAGSVGKALPQRHGLGAGQDSPGHRTSVVHRGGVGGVRGGGVGGAWGQGGAHGGELCFKEPHTLRGPRGWSLQGWLAAGRPRKGSVFPRGRAAFSSCVLQRAGWGPPQVGGCKITEVISAGFCPQFPPLTYLIPCNFLGDKSVICPNEVSLGGLPGRSWSPETPSRG